MGVEIDTSGFDELERKLEEISGENEVSFGELFPDSFIKTHTDFKTLEELFEESEYKVETQEDFEQIPQEGWDEFIENNTEFSNWKDMAGKAFQEWVSKKLNID